MKLYIDDYQSVIAFASKVKKAAPRTAHPPLVLNADIGFLRYETSLTGHEKVTQMKYLSNALRTLEMLPLMEATATRTGQPTQMSWVGSYIHQLHSLTKHPLLPSEGMLAHLYDKSKYTAISHYGDTKLLCVMFISELAKGVSKERAVINTL